MNAAWLNAAVLIALIPAAARAQSGAAVSGAGPAAALSDAVEVPFTLTVNHVPKGDVILVLAGGEVFIDRADLLAAGLTLDGGEDVVVAERKLLRLKSVSPPLRFELDEQAIELRIIAPPELLPHTAIDLAARPPDIEYRTDTSAFLNYAPHVDHRGRFVMYEEMGLSLDGALLFSSAYLSNQREPVRGLTNLVVDNRRKLIRYTLGDALVRTGALGSGGFVGGMTISRDYELDPYAIKTPRLGLRGSTPTPATVDVLVNGTRVRSEEIAPGTFEINNVNIGGGSGLAGYVIRDVFGNEQHVATPFYASSDALNPGFEEYTYSVGALRREVSNASWDYGQPVAYATHRRGLDEHFTLGGRAEASDERVSAGPSLTAITGVGQFDLDLGASYDTDGSLGAASQLAYSYSSPFFGASAVARVTSNRYSNVELAPQEDRAIAAFEALLSVPVGSRLTLTYRSAVASTRDEGAFVSLAGQTSVRITNSLNWLTMAVRTKREREPADWELTTTLSYSFGRGYGAQLSGVVAPDYESLRVQTSKSLPPGEGFGYRAAANLAEVVSAEATLQYQTLFGRYGASASTYGSAAQGALDAAGAIVVVPRVGVFPSLPVQSAFGLIRVPGVAGVRGYGNHQELGTTDRNGNLVVTNILSYYGNHLSIAPEDVPLEYELESTEQVLAPAPRGVALAVFRVRMPHFYRGRLVVVSTGGAREAPTYGQLHIAQAREQAVSPLGKEGEFELSGIAPGSYPALIEWPRGTCAFEFVLPESEETVIELGELTCSGATIVPAPDALP
jgi:outer membrane usher protein